MGVIGGLAFTVLIAAVIAAWIVSSTIADVGAVVVAELQAIRKELDASKHGTIGYEIIKEIRLVEKTLERLAP